ncbi:dihydroxyacetone kinase family protein [Microbacterium sp. CFH 90308]|uniref:Dihydroxyacetone kinase family protein n=1 Tax=Microbacterium salsuginis TaxID=2722803 RepID=A0ABX1KGK9_9MICO|nr:dihydroxyacetone kinase family protein [Microbacterium sp. CFH 90308]NLP85254.1 dihydroxyacetone kinase family protein [Microbacterium sp. CFH 90308]
MTRIANDAADFVPQALAGFVAAHGDLVRAVDGGVVRASPAPRGSVAVVVGGGSGHYPAFAGVVGAGMASGAVCGNIFTSPSAGQAYRVAKAAHRGGGVLFSFGNYAGDVLHFGEAQERLREEGIDARTVLCTDDIASAPIDEIHKRRGIAGDFTVFKIAGAAAERGDSLDEVERLARLANHRTRTLGVAFGGCTFPGADEPLFTVPEGMMSIGLGIHGEPGIRDVPRTSSAELAQTLVDALLGDVPEHRGDRVAVIVNGLGTVKYEELFVLFGDVSSRLEEAGITVVQPEVGELVTSLDMAGASVTFLWLDDELEPLWAAPAYTPAYRKGRVEIVTADAVDDEAEVDVDAAVDVVEASQWSQHAAAVALTYLEVVRTTIHEHETELGRIDAIAGDGDHGVGMRTGIDAATDAADPAVGLSAMLTAAGDAWSEKAGGTSGALWGAMLRAIGRALDHDDADLRHAVADAARAALDAVTSRGGAHVGDKTMVDALDPFARTLAARLDAGAGAGAEIGAALHAAARAATEAAAATSGLRPALGRARPLAEKSLGHPDAGATSLALIATAIAEASTSRPTREEER